MSRIMRRIKQSINYVTDSGRREVAIGILTAMIVISLFAPWIFITIPNGYFGALWYRFGGGVADYPLRDGIHAIFPWNHIYSYYLRQQVDTQEYTAITQDGIAVKMQVSLVYHLLPDRIPVLQAQVGPEYRVVLIHPSVGAEVRRVAASHTIEALYNGNRQAVENELYNDILEAPQNRLGGRGDLRDIDLVYCDEVYIRNVELPDRLAQAILEKAGQQQLAESYTFRLDRERLEAQRKQIEASGIAAFQQTVQQGISPTYLQWRGIEATLQLATSPNAKVIVIGSGKDGLPIIFNSDGFTAPGQPVRPAMSAVPALAESGKPDIVAAPSNPLTGAAAANIPPAANHNPAPPKPKASTAANATDFTVHLPFRIPYLGNNTSP